MNPPQDNRTNNVHESNITGFNNNCNSLEHSSNINCNDPFCSCFSGSNNIVPTQTSILPDHNNNHSYNTSNNNAIVSPDHNYLFLLGKIFNTRKQDL